MIGPGQRCNSTAARVSDGAVVVGTQLGANEHPLAGFRRLEAVAVTVARVVGETVVVAETDRLTA